MVKLIHGYRVSRRGQLVVGCAGVLFDASRQRILLTRRADNGRWCLPGGRMEAGESATEACLREVREETGLACEVVRLIGVYSNRDLLVQYADGNCFQFLSLCFEVRQMGGQPGLSDETTGLGFYTRAEIATMDLLEHHVQRVEDAFAAQLIPFIRE